MAGASVPVTEIQELQGFYRFSPSPTFFLTVQPKKSAACNPAFRVGAMTYFVVTPCLSHE
jgi:hypothetical protein